MTKHEMDEAAPGSPITEAARQALARTAAGSAADLIPAPAPLAIVDTADTPGPEAQTYYAQFTGTTSGTVVVVLGEAISAALGETGDDTTGEDIIGPALNTAAEAGGPCVMEEVRAGTLADVPGRTDLALVALGADGQTQAWVGLIIASTAASSPPAQKAAPATESMAGNDTNHMRMELLRGVEMTLSVEIGRSRMLVRDLLQLNPGSVVELDRGAGEPADLLVNGRLIARGEVVVVDEEFGLRITQLVNTEENPTETT